MADPFGIFLADLRNCPRLSPAEEYAAGVAWRDFADEEARQRMILSILPWAVRRACNWCRSRPLSHEDASSLASEGAIAAVDTYDPDKGRLSTHVAWHVRQKVQRYVDQDLTVIHVPSCGKSSPATQPYARQVLQGVASLSTPTGHHGTDKGELGDLLTDYSVSAQQVVATVEQQEERQQLHGLVDRLPRRLREIILGRLRGQSLEEIGNKFRVTRERVRQLEYKAHAMLRQLVQRQAQNLPLDTLIKEPFVMFVDDPAAPTDPGSISDDLTRLLDTVTQAQIETAIRENDLQLQTARERHDEKAYKLGVLLQMAQHRDGPGVVHKLGSPRNSGRETNKDKIVRFLQNLNGVACTNRQITDGTGINGSTVSAILTLGSNRHLFERTEDGWRFKPQSS